MTTPTRLAEIAERHEKATPGEWTADTPIKGWVDIKATPAGPLSQPPSAYGVACVRPGRKTQADADFIAHAHQDVPWLIAQLTAAQARSREDAEIMRAGSAALSWAAIQSDPNLTKQICALCHSWVWDDSEENIKPIAHTPDCLVTKLRARADELEGRTDV